ncbi:MAG: DUF1295 domain-containing protein [Bacteroidales bacterium]|nr:DUF1295 domain-containing protein [Bacteroidales bacterium]MBN2758618.1 DUF1295 domain-containing protein [Bacteroidales bacterium]
MEYGFGIFFSWWFTVIFLIFNYGLNFLFQTNFRYRFNKVPHLKFYSRLNTIFFYILLIFSSIIKLHFSINFIIGIVIYILGMLLYISSMYYFAINEFDKPVTSGVYKISRHPLYLGFFIIYLGVFIATLNIFVLILNIVISFISYKIAIQEEIDCENMYMKEYQQYKLKVKRIINL